MKKECRVVMLPTNKEAILNKVHSKLNNHLNKSNTLTYNQTGLNGISHTPYNLYITSDEEIKEGDWCIMLDSAGNVFSNPQQYTDPKTQHLNKGLRKIIATTDSSLTYFLKEDIKKVGAEHNLPQIPQSFIEYFVSKYNKGNIITKVVVEYEEHKVCVKCNRIVLNFHCLCGESNNYKRKYKLKIDENNQISISIVEKSYTREEVEELIYLFSTHLGLTSTKEDREWIKNNL